MEKGNSPSPHECRRLENELENIWELNTGKYVTCCSCCHIKKLTLIIGIVDIVAVALLTTTYAVSFFLVDYIPIAVFLGIILTFAVIAPLFITDFIFACLLIHGIRKESTILMLPYMFKSFGLSLFSIVLAWFCYTEPNLTNSFYLAVCLLHIYLFWIVWRCFQCFVYKQVWHQINAVLARTNHNFHSTDISQTYILNGKAASPYSMDLDSRMLTNSEKAV